MVRLFCNFPLLSIAVRFVRARARLLVGREKEHTETPDETNVFKSGPLTKTSIHTVFRGRLRRCNQTKRNLPLAFRAANKLEGKWKVSPCLVAPPHAAAGYSTKSGICWRTTFEDICAVRKNDVPKSLFSSKK